MKYKEIYTENDYKNMITIFDNALSEGKSFEEAAKISGYADILDEQSLEDLKLLSDSFRNINDVLDEFRDNPELDRNLLNPLKEHLEKLANQIELEGY